MSQSYWIEQAFLRPAFVNDEAWEKIFSIFLDHVGNPLEDLPGSLQDDIDRLQAQTS